MRTAQQAGLADEVVDASNEQGNMYTNMADHPQALAYYRQAAAYAAQVAPASYRAIVLQAVLNELGTGNVQAGNYPQALAALHR